VADRHVIPYDFGEAKAAIERAALAQKGAEGFIKSSFKEYAAAERAYRQALANRIVQLRADGTPATVTNDLARGDKHVSDLRYARDVQAGVKEAALSAVWRHSANRRELEQLVNWSMKLEP